MFIDKQNREADHKLNFWHGQHFYKGEREREREREGERERQSDRERELVCVCEKEGISSADVSPGFITTDASKDLFIPC